MLRKAVETRVLFKNSINVNIPDGYAEQTISCNKVYLGIKKRERKGFFSVSGKSRAKKPV